MDTCSHKLVQKSTKEKQVERRKFLFTKPAGICFSNYGFMTPSDYVTRLKHQRSLLLRFDVEIKSFGFIAFTAISFGFKGFTKINKIC
jgi:hypothetical protein